MRYLDRAELETWVLYVSGAPAGYVELERQEFGTQVEIAYFGLFPEFTGQRLGGYLLTFALERAWLPEVRRVWVHTCSLDHPAALTNYEARGMRLFKEESEDRLLPARPSRTWPPTM
jgi:GNAT superfamily N-acetyltransferase